MEPSESENKSLKTQRKRRKRLYCTIRGQMEFYFSDSNLSKDRFLSQVISKNNDGYVDIDVFLRFNKIRNLINDKNDIVNALSSSDKLEVSTDKTKIRRKTPIKKLENVDDCTIYVENFSDKADMDWLKNYFSSFGEVTYVSLPKFKSNGQPKGFAFVEFSTPDAAKRACEHFSISKSDTDSNVFVEPTLEPPTKKRKLDTKENQATETRTPDIVQKTEIKKEEKTAPEEVQAPAKQGDDSTREKKKKKRKRRKKAKNDQKNSTNLYVVSKSEWKRMRNKYLSLQKTNMAQLKKSLGLLKKNREISETDNVKEEKPSTDFTPGVIVKLTLSKQISNIKEFKELVKTVVDVAYIDWDYKADSMYIRNHCAEDGAKLLKSNVVLAHGSASILEGDDEVSYWKKIEADRQTKHNTKPVRPKIRGREKIISQAEMLLNAPKHIHFDD